MNSTFKRLLLSAFFFQTLFAFGMQGERATYECGTICDNGKKELLLEVVSDAFQNTESVNAKDFINNTFQIFNLKADISSQHVNLLFYHGELL